jgi:uncharacterized protein
MSVALQTYSYAVTHRVCGSARLTVAGEAVTLRPSGALWLEAASTLIVADVHFEKGSAYAARGQMLPPFDTRETLRRLTIEARATVAARIVFLGDAFHDGEAESRLSDGDRDGIEALAREVQLVWIVGNHDAEGPKALPGEGS